MCPTKYSKAIIIQMQYIHTYIHTCMYIYDYTTSNQFSLEFPTSMYVCPCTQYCTSPVYSISPPRDIHIYVYIPSGVSASQMGDGSAPGGWVVYRYLFPPPPQDYIYPAACHPVECRHCFCNCESQVLTST